MKSITLQVSDPVFRQMEEFAQRASRPVEEVLREFVERRWAPPPTQPQSIFDHEPADLGAALLPWSSRAEMLEGFFDRD